MARVALFALVLAAACACATAELAPFKNAGAPPFLAGYANAVDADGKIIGMGVTTGQTYAAISVSDDEDKDAHTELTVYSSWECGPEAGSYKAIYKTISLEADGAILDVAEKCEYGTFDAKTGENKWAAKEGECPTETDSTNKVVQRLTEEANSC